MEPPRHNGNPPRNTGESTPKHRRTHAGTPENPRRNTRDPRRNTGDSRRNTEDSRRNTGEPTPEHRRTHAGTPGSRRNTGDPRRNIGDPCRNTGDPHQNTGTHSSIGSSRILPCPNRRLSITVLFRCSITTHRRFSRTRTPAGTGGVVSGRLQDVRGSPRERRRVLPAPLSRQATPLTQDLDSHQIAVRLLEVCPRQFAFWRNRGDDLGEKTKFPVKNMKYFVAALQSFSLSTANSIQHVIYILAKNIANMCVHHYGSGNRSSRKSRCFEPG